jgi:chorismate mutase
MDKNIPTTDPAQIEQLIERLKQTNLEPHETQVLERVLRSFLVGQTIQSINSTTSRKEI